MRSSKGATIDEHGSGWGTFRCSASIELRVSGVLVLASYLAECRGGAMKGSARARIRSATTRAAAFSGSITLEGGTGSYAGASGKASFSGTINRTSYAMSLHIAGRVRL